MSHNAVWIADLSLDDLLDDPVTRAVMAADRVDAEELGAMLRTISVGAGIPSGNQGRHAGACCAAYQ
jgi:hypothetical protein